MKGVFLILKKLMILFSVFSIFVLLGIFLLNDIPFPNKDLLEHKLSDSKGSIIFSKEEQIFIERYKNKIFHLGRHPYGGMDYFKNYDTEYGYLPDVLRLIHKETGLTVQIQTYPDWQSLWNDFESNRIDLIFGAKAKAEHLKYMTFSDPIVRHPYAVLARKQSLIRSIADLDGKHIAFLEQDSAILSFQEKFNKIQMVVDTYENPNQLLKALEENTVDGVVLPSGPILSQFLTAFPNVNSIAQVSAITSDMSLAVKKELVLFSNIINKVLKYYAEDEIKIAIEQAEVSFNRKNLGLTKEEIEWLDANPTVITAVSDNYLPLNYHKDGEYKGILGEMFTKTCRLVGLKPKIVTGDFQELYQKAVMGEIDALSLSKSEERLNYFIFTDPVIPESNIIYGRQDMPYVYDIYGLEGKRIAVIPGYWYYNSLNKNLSQATFVEAQSIADCLKLLKKNKADYFIENPTVVEFHISGLNYSGIVEKGVATSDSLFYWAINKNKPILASVLQKSLHLISYEEEKYNALMEVPPLVPLRYRNMTFIIILLSCAILIIAIYVLSTLKRLAEEKAYNKFLEERTRILYLDFLTGVKNRACFYETSKEFDTMPFPQTFLTADINNLKFVNDTYGHHIGDRLIKKCSDILQKIFPKELIFRMGGDEFLVVYFPKNQQQILEHIQKIKDLSDQSTIQEDGAIISEVSMAIGFYTRQSPEEPFEEAIKKSDHDMYENKKKIKDNYDF